MGSIIVGLVRNRHYSGIVLSQGGRRFGSMIYLRRDRLDVHSKGPRRTARIAGEFHMRGFGFDPSSFWSTGATRVRLYLPSSGCYASS